MFDRDGHRRNGLLLKISNPLPAARDASGVRKALVRGRRTQRPETLEPHSPG